VHDACITLFLNQTTNTLERRPDVSSFKIGNASSKISVQKQRHNW